MAPGLRGLARGRRTIASWDEDSVTIAVEAARILHQALPDATAAALTLASTTLPFAERLKAVDRDLTHNVGGHPHRNVCALTIMCRDGA